MVIFDNLQGHHEDGIINTHEVPSPVPGTQELPDPWWVRWSFCSEQYRLVGHPLRDVSCASIYTEVWKALGIVSPSQREQYSYPLWWWWWWFTWACSLNFTWAWGGLCFALYSLPPELRGHSLTEAAAVQRIRDRVAVQWFDPTLKITYSTFLWVDQNEIWAHGNTKVWERRNVQRTSLSGMFLPPGNIGFNRESSLSTST